MAGPVGDCPVSYFGDRHQHGHHTAVHNRTGPPPGRALITTVTLAELTVGSLVATTDEERADRQATGKKRDPAGLASQRSGPKGGFCQPSGRALLDESSPGGAPGQRRRCIHSELIYAPCLIAYSSKMPTSVNPNLRCKATEASLGRAIPATARCTVSERSSSKRAPYRREPTPPARTSGSM